MGDVGVSLSEIIEVRGCGLNDEELLALIIIGCEVLTKTPAGVFSPEHVILHTDGELEIRSVSRDEVSDEYVPPEMREGNTDVDPGSVHVFCLGEVVRFAGAAESGNADLFSLLNVMTVAHVATRPSIIRLGQMAKNKLAIQNPRALLAEMYVLVMGDEAEDIDDLDISSGEYIPNAFGESADLQNFKWNHEQAEINKSDTADQQKKLSQRDPFAGEEEDTKMWISGRDPFNAAVAECRSATLSEVNANGNSQEHSEKQKRQSTSEMLLEQNEEEEKSMPLSNGTRHSRSHDFDDIVEYNEELDSSDENIESTMVPAAASEDDIEKDELLGYNKHKRIPAEVIPKFTDTVSSLSPISELTEEKADGGQKTTIPAVASLDHPKIVGEESSIRRSNSESLVGDKIMTQPQIDFPKKENGNESQVPKSMNNELISPVETFNASAPDEQQFVRRNSLLPNRISGRKPSSRHFKRKLKAEPEFVKNANAPSICLKAPAQRKKKVTLHRVEQTDVTVELLSGRHVEVSCRSDAVASEIADVVMRHMNFNENSFFGVTVLRDGEHFFLEDHQRLEKFAPPGWKNARQHGFCKRFYMLFLRFRYYPASLAFIRTEVVLHELYLQLRRDILDDRIQPKRHIVYDLAAFALQAEYSDRPNVAVSDYFNVQHYIPKRYLDDCDEKAVIQEVIEKHGKYRGMKNQDAEKRFILLCQRLPDYGAHLHRVFTSKPSVNLGNTPLGDPETGVAQWIGILSRGIILFEEESGGRNAQIEHLWQNTQTLQFDKKRFVIVSEVHQPSRNIFFTDHYTKSAYFVRFAASQHRFMIKMRQWNHTLRHDSPFQFRKIPDVGADTGCVEEIPSVDGHLSAPNLPSTPTVDVAESRNQHVSDGSSLKKYANVVDGNNLKPRASSSTDADLHMEESSVEESVGNNEGYTLEILLEKDPSSGLGLTLVDGNLNGVKGVYVKSVSEEGVGKRGGVSVGDRLISVNNVSLAGKDRHATVDLVKRGGDIVRLKIFRLDAISSALASGVVKVKSDSDDQKESKNHSMPVNEGSRSRTPPLPRKQSNILKKRARAVSDFGAVGDTLPDLNSEDLLANLRSESKLGLRPENLLNDERKVGYSMPVASMYKFDDVGDELTGHMPKRSNTIPYSLKADENEWLRTGNDGDHQRNLVKDWKSKRDYRKKPNLDWADDLDDIVEPLSSNVSIVTLVRNESGSLGFQIASSGGNVYVKQITAEPALSCPDIQMGDKIILVNDEKVQNLTHQQVVDLLRKGGETVVIGLQHSDKEMSTPDGNEQTVRVVLEKSQAGSLGLSLAKKTGFDGIYIRMISSGSAADIDGTLHVGDKIWKVNGQLVSNCTPGAIVDLLKVASSPVEIVVKRPIAK